MIKPTPYVVRRIVARVTVDRFGPEREDMPRGISTGRASAETRILRGVRVVSHAALVTSASSAS